LPENVLRPENYNIGLNNSAVGLLLWWELNPFQKSAYGSDRLPPNQTKNGID